MTKTPNATGSPRPVAPIFLRWTSCSLNWAWPTVFKVRRVARSGTCLTHFPRGGFLFIAKLEDATIDAVTCGTSRHALCLFSSRTTRVSAFRSSPLLFGGVRWLVVSVRRWALLLLLVLLLLLQLPQRPIYNDFRRQGGRVVLAGQTNNNWWSFLVESSISVCA